MTGVVLDGHFLFFVPAAGINILSHSLSSLNSVLSLNLWSTSIEGLNIFLEFNAGHTLIQFHVIGFS